MYDKKEIKNPISYGFYKGTDMASKKLYRLHNTF